MSGEPAAPWIEKKADNKKSGARIAGAGSCFVCCFAGAGGGSVHAAHVRGSLLGQIGHQGLGGQDHVPEQVIDFLCAVNR